MIRHTEISLALFFLLIAVVLSAAAQQPPGIPPRSGPQIGRPAAGVQARPIPYRAPCVSARCGIFPRLHVSAGVAYVPGVTLSIESETGSPSVEARGYPPFGPDRDGPVNYPAFPVRDPGAAPDVHGRWIYEDGEIDPTYGCLWNVNQGGLGHRSPDVCSEAFDFGSFGVQDAIEQTSTDDGGRGVSVTWSEILDGINSTPNHTEQPSAVVSSAASQRRRFERRASEWAPYLELGYALNRYSEILASFSWFGLDAEENSELSDTVTIERRGFRDTFSFASHGSGGWGADVAESSASPGSAYIFPHGRVGFPGSQALPPGRREFFSVSQSSSVLHTTRVELDMTVYRMRLGYRLFTGTPGETRVGVTAGMMGAVTPYELQTHSAIIPIQPSPGAAGAAAYAPLHRSDSKTSADPFTAGFFGGLHARLGYRRLFLAGDVSYDYFFRRISTEGNPELDVNLSGVVLSVGVGSSF